ncbi:UDP-2,4-diacetamido-2,4,6-trideoxy-beta-L-altropyranose hydrolase [Leptolyngbya cf. ectocarpi LEGE 11479]|uniref:UDP-2,4-diacetamido-2,4, 6-trideoxy-beta-L-altropyranose hydrolase n=1 Tax=Leptolyngbya cf. ectocarpi LEGE 11479 TaxID=1828722 RepID=A0A928ZVW2_LEPEC|nr:UDP-2,4-diacetamido-2,4,6-trideoxy-beta-L-altropyranose hydrolase [Leptolyngbya ectocarpi]MBE9068428.1 UDP-2,4-diacetamido-2,4,6-trideoxy-beta-L-altropyranose hydrolase [Leptolyngbya cf. ectocarpi LEGE 11479]
MSLLIRSDASSKIGTGHVVRCMALAQAWLEVDVPVTFLMAIKAPALESRLQAEGIKVDYLLVSPGSQEDAEQTVIKAKALGSLWVVVDGYQFGVDYQRTIKIAGLKLLLLDDYGHAKHYCADLVLNQNVCAQEKLYANRESSTQLLLGTSYALLRKEFWLWQGWQRKIPTVARKILVTLGGADPDNITFKVIEALKKLKVNNLEVIVVVGGSNPHYEQLQKVVEASEIAITLHRNVAHMSELMAWADLAVTAGGSTCWELAFMGLPSLMIILAENQCAIAEKLDTVGAAINLGWHNNISTNTLRQQTYRLVNTPNLRQAMTESSRQLVDGEGSQRVLMHLQNQRLRLRTVNEDDCKLIWQWANDPDVRARSFSSQPIPWDEHVQWFNAKQKALDCRFYLALDLHDSPLGVIRFDLHQDNATVSVTIDSKFRAQGYGNQLINLATAKLFRTSNITYIYAYIQPDNQASLRAFQKADFRKLGTVTHKGLPTIKLLKEQHRCNSIKNDLAMPSNQS